MASIFISYRRSDTQDSANRLYNMLAKAFGKDAIFLDTEAILPGIDFEDEINNQIEQCKVMLVVIGGHWLEELIERQTKPKDYVRYEIGNGLVNPELTVIPVMVNGTTPLTADDLELFDDLKTLVRLNVHQIASGRLFKASVIELIKDLTKFDIPIIRTSNKSTRNTTMTNTGTINTGAVSGGVVAGQIMGNVSVNDIPAQRLQLQADLQQIEKKIRQVTSQRNTAQEHFESDQLAARFASRGDSKSMAVFMYIGALLVGAVVAVAIDVVAGIGAGIVLLIAAVVIQSRQVKEPPSSASNENIDKLNRMLKTLARQKNQIESDIKHLGK